MPDYRAINPVPFTIAGACLNPDGSPANLTGRTVTLHMRRFYRSTTAANAGAAQTFTATIVGDPTQGNVSYSVTSGNFASIPAYSKHELWFTDNAGGRYPLTYNLTLEVGG